MALYGLLLMMGVNFLYVNGFGFQMAPLKMTIRIPSDSPVPFQSPLSGPSPMGLPFSLMAFPPIFNPMEPMGEELDADARGDINGPMGNVTTKNKTESKDGFKVTTITSDGPGFHSYIKEYEKDGNDTNGNATAGAAGPPADISSLLSSGKIFDIMKKLRNMDRKKPTKCKKCDKGKFCDPIFHLCRKKFSEGRTCMAQKQCGKSLRCQWGKCQKAKKGDPGTFCKGNAQCNGDACCRNTPGSFHLMCIPQQTEGSICGLHERTESVAKLFYVVKRSTVGTCSPCKGGLKCADTGGSRFKRCAKDSYIEKAAEELEDDNPSNAITDDDKDKGDDGSGEEEPNVAPDVPDRHDKQGDEREEEEEDDRKDDEEDEKKKEDEKKEDESDKEEDEDDDDEEKAEGKNKDKLSNDDEVEEDDEDDKNKQKKKKPISNGDGMDIQIPKKKKKKGTGKKGKGKGKGKKD